MPEFDFPVGTSSNPCPLLLAELLSEKNDDVSVRTIRDGHRNCPRCKGAGYVEQEVDIVETLEALGDS